MPKGAGQKIKLKQGDMKSRVSSILTVIMWKDRQTANLLKNVDASPAKGSFSDEHGKGLKLAIVKDCHRQIGYVDKSDCMMNSYCICRQRSYSSTFSILPFQQFLSFSPLVVQNYHTQTVQIDIGEGPNSRGMKVALTSEHERIKSYPIYQPDKVLDTSKSGLWKGREFGAMCVSPKTKKQEWHLSIQNAM